MAALMRAQLRLGLSVLLATAVLLGGLPLLFLVVPGASDVQVGPVPLPWLALGVMVYPVVVMAARYYVRHSERIERDFADLVARR